MKTDFNILSPSDMLLWIQSQPSRHFVVGYSGGVDSHVLLHLVKAAIDGLRHQSDDKIGVNTFGVRPLSKGHRSGMPVVEGSDPKLAAGMPAGDEGSDPKFAGVPDPNFDIDPNYDVQVSALHIHHGLSPKADDWAKHCEHICSEVKIPLTVLWVDAAVYEGRSPEEVAREARFKAFEQYLKPTECLLLAHHAEDQAETILLRLFRGAGPTGLSGMTERSRIGAADVLRPFLSVSKQDILEYAKQHQLSWIEDESNHNPRFDRNFLRNEIVPKLTARWPRVIRSVNRAGSLCLETATAVQVLAKEDYGTVLGTLENSLSVPGLLNLDTARRRGVIRYWFLQQGSLPPSREHMERIDAEVLGAKPDKHPKLKLGEYEIRRKQKNLMLIRLSVPERSNQKS